LTIVPLRAQFFLGRKYAVLEEELETTVVCIVSVEGNDYEIPVQVTLHTERISTASGDELLAVFLLSDIPSPSELKRTVREVITG